MSDITEPNPTILKIVEQQYRNDNEVSKEQKPQIALLMTHSFADPRTRKAMESIQELNKALENLEDKYEKDGVGIRKSFTGGDLGELTKLTLKSKDKSIDLTSGEEFEAFKKIYDKRASQVKGLYLNVLRIAATDDLSAKVALRAGGMLYSMTGTSEFEHKLLDTLKKEIKEIKEPEKQMNSGVDEQMQRALAAFENSAGELPAGGSPESLAVARPRKGHGGFDRA
jgi:hypothetical protein